MKRGTDHIRIGLQTALSALRARNLAHLRDGMVTTPDKTSIKHFTVISEETDTEATLRDTAHKIIRGAPNSIVLVTDKTRLYSRENQSQLCT